MQTSLPRDEAFVDRQQAIHSYRENRQRTKTIFDLLDSGAYYERPIPLRHPVVFYEGHVPAFATNCFLKKALGHPGIDNELEVLFARGIDPADQAAFDTVSLKEWPDRNRVQRYGQRVDAVILDALESSVIEGNGNPTLRRGQGVFTMLEHEVMHQETLLYMWHRFDVGRKTRPAGTRQILTSDDGLVDQVMVEVPAGRATLGAYPQEISFGWDNEFPRHLEDVQAFDIDLFNVTNGSYLGFVDSGGYEKREFWSESAWQRRSVGQKRDNPIFWVQEEGVWHWRGLFEMIPLPLDWPVFVTHDEASAYARWKGFRLPTEPEFHRAAYGAPDGSESEYPWGSAEPNEFHGNFDFWHWDPVPVGSYPNGVSAWGVHDLVGNGWEWTSTPFKGFPGFEPMASYPEYSSDFYDGDHFVVKGASPATGRGLIRRSFRNWFRPDYPYMYATFRCVRDHH